MTTPFYLSQITMPYESALHNRLRSSYDWHRWIWKAFPDEPDAIRDFLFRVDELDRRVRILLLSREQPMAIGEYAWETRAISDAFLGFDAYRFQSRVNPTFRRSSDHRRIALYHEDEIREWLARKFSVMGAELISAEIGNPVEESFFKDGHRGKHVVADIRGVLAVRDREAFADGFACGIGAAKGFGYGMLMLQPIQN